MKTTFDDYRVNLFKKKIKSAINEVHEIDRMRFSYSIGKTHLIFDPCRYVEKDSVVEIVSKGLNRNSIEYTIKRNPFGFYSDMPEDDQPVWYIKIPIDQEALPERKRL